MKGWHFGRCCMLTGIRGKMILPVMLVLLVFPVATYFAFGRVSRTYVRDIARRDIARTLEDVTTIAGEVFDEGNSETDDLDVGQQFLKRLRTAAVNQPMDAQVIALNAKIRRTYPRIFDTNSDVPAVIDHFQKQLESAPATVATGIATAFQLENREYYGVVVALGDHAPERTKYIIAYTKVYNTDALLGAAGQLVLLITGVLALCMLAVLWFASTGISGPIDRLSRWAHAARGGKLSQIEGGSNVREIGELIDAVNDMSGRLARYDAEQRAFFQNVSHELRTPLMAIRGYAEGLVSDVFDDKRAVATIILGECNRLSDMVGELLVMTQLDGTQVRVQPRAVSLRDFLEGSLKTLEGLALSRDVALCVEQEGLETVRVMADEELLSQAFLNVAANCIRHARKCVSFALRETSDRVSIVVMDDGPGIAPEDALHIFERFYKGRNGSTGLGLAIAKSAMAHMGGDIEARNGELGAVFELSFIKPGGAGVHAN